MIGLLPVLLACAKTGTPPKLAEAAPRLPAPVADIYGHHVTEPSDPLLARAMGSLPWDEVLSGAAAGVALDLADDVAASPYRLRWRAVRAGYPYPITHYASARVAQGAMPDALLAEVRARGAQGGDTGLARARDGEEDIWVYLAGRPRAELGRIAREYAVGEAAELGPGRWKVADPAGGVRETNGRLVLDRAGEWLVQAVDAQGPVATLPLYVGRDTPLEPPITADAAGDTVEARAQAVLAALWGWYGRDAPAFDTGLDSVARARLNLLLAGGPVPAAEEQLRRAGFVDGPVAGADCRAADPVACLDGIWWSPDRRAVLAGDFRALGVASAVRDGETILVVVGAG